MNLAEFIAEARKGESFRALEKKADDLSHVYIWKLEKGDRTKPSDATVEKLSTALNLGGRQKQIFKLLVERDIDNALYQLMLTRKEIPWPLLEAAARISARGNRARTEEDWLRVIETVKELI